MTPKVKKNEKNEPSPEGEIVEYIPSTETKTPSRKGRTPKYATEEERKAARKEQNRRYREKKKKELIELRRLAEKEKQNEKQKQNQD